MTNFCGVVAIRLEKEGCIGLRGDSKIYIHGFDIFRYRPNAMVNIIIFVQLRSKFIPCVLALNFFC